MNRKDLERQIQLREEQFNRSESALAGLQDNYDTAQLSGDESKCKRALAALEEGRQAMTISQDGLRLLREKLAQAIDEERAHAIRLRRDEGEALSEKLQKFLVDRIARKQADLIADLEAYNAGMMVFDVVNAEVIGAGLDPLPHPEAIRCEPARVIEAARTQSRTEEYIINSADVVSGTHGRPVEPIYAKRTVTQHVPETRAAAYNPPAFLTTVFLPEIVAGHPSWAGEKGELQFARFRDSAKPMTLDQAQTQFAAALKGL